MESNVVNVAFGSLKTKTTKEMYRLDMEQYLHFTDIDLPEYYRVDFGLDEMGDTISVIGTTDGVLIPDNLLTNPGKLHAWVWLDTGTYGGKTCYHVIIPIKKRGNITDIEPTPGEQYTIDSLIAAMNDAVDDAEASATVAEGYASNASESADRAEQAAQDVVDKVARAEAAAQAAEASEQNAHASEVAAQAAANNAEQSEQTASAKAQEASQSAQTATAKATEASNSAAQAAASAASIEGDVAEAERAAQQATQAASAASQSATAAQGSATAASGSATVATNKAAEASESATAASGKATEAANSATAAQTAQTRAEAAQAAAEAAQQAAEEAAQEAQTILVNKAPVITDTASGAIATFPDGAENLPLKKLTAQITPVQDLHGYDSPWPARGGKNKLNDSVRHFANNNVYFGGATSATTLSLILPAGTYTYTCKYKSSNNVNIYAKNIQTATNIEGFPKYGSGSSNTTTQTFTLTETTQISFYTYSTNITSVDDVEFAIVESGSSFTSYAPYSNLCPISGWTGLEGQRTGVNVWDEETEIGRLDTNTGADYPSSAQLRTKNYVPVIGGKTYYFGTPTLTGSGQGMWILFYDDSKSVISGYTPPESVDKYQNAFRPQNKAMTVPTNAKYLRFYLTPEYGTTYVGNIFINYPSTDTSYHAYTSESLSVSWQDTAGTVYGGTMTVNEDGSGELVVDKYLYVYDGTEYFAKSGTALNGFYNQLTANTRPHNWPKMIDYGTSRITDERSSMFRPTRDVNTYKQNYGYVYFDSGHNFDAPPETFGATVDSFKAKLAELYAAGTPVSVFCKIAEPLTYHFDNLEQLSTVLGTNNIFVDCGSTEVGYRADTKLYIDKKLAAIVAALS